MDHKVAVAYWNSGGYYLEIIPHVWHRYESDMLRKASALGYTHVCVKHGWFDGKEFVVDDILPHTHRIPKIYRKVQMPDMEE